MPKMIKYHFKTWIRALSYFVTMQKRAYINLVVKGLKQSFFSPKHVSLNVNCVKFGGVLCIFSRMILGYRPTTLWLTVNISKLYNSL